MLIQTTVPMYVLSSGVPIGCSFVCVCSRAFDGVLPILRITIADPI